MTTLASIRINRLRQYYRDHEFAEAYGRQLLILLSAILLIGNHILPLCAY